MMTYRALLLLLLAQLLLGAAPSSEIRKPSAPDSSRPLLTSEQLAQRLRASTLVVTCTIRGKPTRLGTGFVVGADGLIATNAHVVSSCVELRVRDASFREYRAVLVRQNIDRDVALIRVPSVTAPAVTLGSTRELVAGTRILAVGHPEGFEYTVSDGIVSAIRVLAPNRRLLQITAPISPGSSGGPVADYSGRVIGMTTMYFERGQNLNFAVSAEDIAELMRDETRFPSSIPPMVSEPEKSEPEKFGPGDETLISEDSLADRAKEAQKNKRYDEAIKILTGALEKYPDSIRIRRELAHVYLAQNDYATAEKYTREVLDRKPDYAPAHVSLGALYLAGGNLLEAKNEALKGIELGADGEDRAAANFVLAGVSLGSGDFKTALTYFDEAGRYPEEQSKSKYHWLRAFALVRLNRIQEANQAAERALELEPDNKEMRAALRKLALPRYAIVVSQDSQWDVLGNFIVKGVVKNIANHSISSVKVYVESLDERGTIVGTGWSYVDPARLAPETTGSFVVYVKGNPQKGKQFRVRADTN